jgi:peptidoglycan-N-acetylglucosamine deacetylase
MFRFLNALLTICIIAFAWITAGCGDDGPCGGYSAPGTLFCRGDEHEHKIALTFDDGPNEPYTSQILAILERNNIKATFFMLGKRVEKYPQIARKILTAGHAIGNHSYSHPHLLQAKPELIALEIKKGDDAIFAATGHHPSLFRPPYGELSPWVIDTAESKGLSIVNWNVTPKDWHSIDAKTISERVTKQTKNGSIVLLHDGDGATDGNRKRVVLALEIFIPILKASGFEFVTVPEMLGLPSER